MTCGEWFDAAIEDRAPNCGTSWSASSVSPGTWRWWIGHFSLKSALSGSVTTFEMAPSSKAAIALLRAAAAASRRTVSICSGAFMLAEAALLDGRRATIGSPPSCSRRTASSSTTAGSGRRSELPEWEVGEEVGSAASASTPSRQAGSQNCRRACFCNALMKATGRITSPGTRRPMARLEYTASSERTRAAREGKFLWSAIFPSRDRKRTQTFLSRPRA